jgi:hypothetical protein
VTIKWGTKNVLTLGTPEVYVAPGLGFGTAPSALPAAANLRVTNVPGGIRIQTDAWTYTGATSGGFVQTIDPNPVISIRVPVTWDAEVGSGDESVRSEWTYRNVAGGAIAVGGSPGYRLTTSGLMKGADGQMVGLIPNPVPTPAVGAEASGTSTTLGGADVKGFTHLGISLWPTVSGTKFPDGANLPFTGPMPALDVTLEYKVTMQEAAGPVAAASPDVFYRDPADQKFKPLTSLLVKGFPAVGGLDPATALIKWGTTDIGATYGPAQVLTHVEAGGAVSALGVTMVDTPGATVTEPTPGTYRLHFPAFTATGPNSTGMLVPIAHAPVPLDDRMYKWVVEVATYTKPTGPVGVGAPVLSSLGPVSLAAGERASLAQTATQVNAVIASGLKLTFQDTSWMNKLDTTTFAPISGVLEPPSKAITEGEIVVRNIRLVRQEAVAP